MNLKYILSRTKKYNLSNTVGGAGQELQQYQSLGLQQAAPFLPHQPAIQSAYIYRKSSVQQRADIDIINSTPIEIEFMKFLNKTYSNIKYEEFIPFVKKIFVIDQLTELMSRFTVSDKVIGQVIHNYFDDNDGIKEELIKYLREKNISGFKTNYILHPSLDPLIDINKLITDFIKTEYLSKGSESWNLICSHGTQIHDTYVIIPPNFELQAGCECGNVIGDCVANELRRTFFNNKKTRQGLFSNKPLYREYHILPNMQIYFSGMNNDNTYMLTGIIHGDIDDVQYGNKMCLSEQPLLNYSICTTAPAAAPDAMPAAAAAAAAAKPAESAAAAAPAAAAVPSTATTECINKSFRVDTNSDFNNKLLQASVGIVPIFVPNISPPNITPERDNKSDKLWGKTFKLHDILRLLHEHIPAISDTPLRYILYSCRNNPDYSCPANPDKYKTLIPNLVTLTNRLSVVIKDMDETSNIRITLEWVVTYVTTILNRLKKGEPISGCIRESDIEEYMHYSGLPRDDLNKHIILAGNYEIYTNLILILLRFNLCINEVIILLEKPEIINPTNVHYDALKAFTTKLWLTDDKFVILVKPPNELRTHIAPDIPLPMPPPHAPSPCRTHSTTSSQ